MLTCCCSLPKSCCATCVNYRVTTPSEDWLTHNTPPARYGDWFVYDIPPARYNAPVVITTPWIEVITIQTMPMGIYS